MYVQTAGILYPPTHFLNGGGINKQGGEQVSTGNEQSFPSHTYRHIYARYGSCRHPARDAFILTRERRRLSSSTSTPKSQETRQTSMKFGSFSVTPTIINPIYSRTSVARIPLGL